MPLNVIRFMDLRKFCKARYTADGEYTAIKGFEDLQPYVKKNRATQGESSGQERLGAGLELQKANSCWSMGV